MRVALIHDHLTQNGGAERVLEALQAMWPQAPTFTLLYDTRTMDETFGHRDIRPSFLQRMPLALSRPRWYLPLMPVATEGYDLQDFDVIISSSSSFSKGVITPGHAIHLCYCHTPTRYLWSDTHSYIRDLRMPRIVKTALPPLLNHLRVWDHHAAQRVDGFIANSETVRRRIDKYYQRESDVIHPPVDIDQFHISRASKDYYLIGGRLVSYKRYDLVIRAFNQLRLPLKVFGSGPEEMRLRKIAGPNVTFLGRVSNEERARLFADAVAFLNPQEEDFGITPVESMAAGRPVIAYRRGGATETVIDSVTGILFEEQSWEEIAASVLQLSEMRFDPVRIRRHAEQFSLQNFHLKMRKQVATAWEQHERKVLGTI
jgi:glycosyltransferase involved in cell wall biosynthesis